MLGTGDRDRMLMFRGYGDGDGVQIATSEHLSIIIEVLRDTVPSSDAKRVIEVIGTDRDDFDAW